jgi:hypothetical protein
VLDGCRNTALFVLRRDDDGENPERLVGIGQ